MELSHRASDALDAMSTGKTDASSAGDQANDVEARIAQIATQRMSNCRTTTAKGPPGFFFK